MPKQVPSPEQGNSSSLSIDDDTCPISLNTIKEIKAEGGRPCWLYGFLYDYDSLHKALLTQFDGNKPGRPVKANLFDPRTHNVLGSKDDILRDGSYCRSSLRQAPVLARKALKKEVILAIGILLFVYVKFSTLSEPVNQKVLRVPLVFLLLFFSRLTTDILCTWAALIEEDKAKSAIDTLLTAHSDFSWSAPQQAKPDATNDETPAAHLKMA